MSLAAKVLEEIEKNAELRRKFFRILIADLMLDPDLRLAIVNSLIREVATKSDLVEVERRVTTSIEDLGKSVSASLDNVPSKDSVKELSLKIEAVARDIGEFKDLAGVVGSVGERFERVEDKVEAIKNRVNALELSLSNLTSKLEDSIPMIEATASALQEKTRSIEDRVSRLTIITLIVMTLALVVLVAQILEVLGY